ncbi:PREDICTED: transcription termination factor 2-like [Drosophila arizonae]|uniref:Transcription termination factor 2-like n=1 Tax=Drosophila arizonae TaxID=7263 RepID=A0ABM1NNS1_DROAR|nr:PREDICTED: transcription termination factor 2-like [Drosophila arizonae]
MQLNISCSEELVDELARFSGRYTVQPESLSNFDVHLENHQIEALQWINLCENMEPFGGILADDKGLGSTCTIICWLLLKKLENRQDTHSNYAGETLIVCPKAILTQWVDKIRAVAGDQLWVYEYIGKNRDISNIYNADIVITTYRVVTYDAKKETNPLDLKWRRLILDEAQAIRNTKSECSKAICTLNSHFRWAVTGDPIQNNEKDFMALLGFLCRGQLRKDKRLCLRRTMSDVQSTEQIQNFPTLKEFPIEV